MWPQQQPQQQHHQAQVPFVYPGFVAPSFPAAPLGVNHPMQHPTSTFVPMGYYGQQQQQVVPGVAPGAPFMVAPPKAEVRGKSNPLDSLFGRSAPVPAVPVAPAPVVTNHGPVAASNDFAFGDFQSGPGAAAADFGEFQGVNSTPFAAPPVAPVVVSQPVQVTQVPAPAPVVPQASIDDLIQKSFQGAFSMGSKSPTPVPKPGVSRPNPAVAPAAPAPVVAESADSGKKKYAPSVDWNNYRSLLVTPAAPVAPVVAPESEKPAVVEQPVADVEFGDFAAAPVEVNSGFTSFFSAPPPAAAAPVVAKEESPKKAEVSEFGEFASADSSSGFVSFFPPQPVAAVVVAPPVEQPVTLVEEAPRKALSSSLEFDDFAFDTTAKVPTVAETPVPAPVALPVPVQEPAAAAAPIEFGDFAAFEPVEAPVVKEDPVPAVVVVEEVKVVPREEVVIVPQKQPLTTEALVQELVGSLRFEDAARVEAHVRASKNLAGLKASYKLAKDDDNLELALKLRKEIAEAEKALLSEATLKDLESRCQDVVPFALGELGAELVARGNSAAGDFMSTYSAAAVTRIARGDPIAALAVIKEGEQLYASISQPAKPSEAVIGNWSKIVQESERELSAFVQACEKASSRSAAVLRTFLSQQKVVNHVRALRRVFAVGLKCSMALEKYAQNGGSSAKLQSLWRKVVAAGVADENVSLTTVRFSEPKCKVCWSFMGPSDAVACVKDCDCHVWCANLMAGRVDPKLETF